MGPDWAALGRDLAGAVIRPEHPDYDVVRKVQIARFDDVRPRAVVRCAGEADVVQAVRFARRSALDLKIRSGGHSSAGFSSGSGLVVDLRPMAAVRVDGDTVVALSGATLGQIFDALEPHGIMVPTGNHRSVGIGGSALTGGWGVVGRRFGLTLDHIIEARIVLADGEVLTCDEARHGDLFWALRGAGAGNFGVVTELRFRAYRAEPLTNFAYTLPFAAAARVLAAWMGWITDLPEAISDVLSLTLAPESDGQPVIALYGAGSGSAATIQARIDALFERAGVAPVSRSCRTMSWLDTTRHWSGEYNHGGLSPSPRAGHQFTRSEYFSRALDDDVVAALIDILLHDRYPGQQRAIDLYHLGGACARVPRDATSYFHRDQLYVVKYKCVVDPRASTVDKSRAHRWILDAYSTLHGHGSGTAWPSYPDPDLPDPLIAYYGGHVDRLIEVKARYDPDDVFHFAQSIPPRRP